MRCNLTVRFVADGMRLLGSQRERMNFRWTRNFREEVSGRDEINTIFKLRSKPLRPGMSKAAERPRARLSPRDRRLEHFHFYSAQAIAARCGFYGGKAASGPVAL